MTKTGKLLISLIFLCFFSFLYLVISLEKEFTFHLLNFDKQKNISRKETKVDLKKIEIAYQKNIKDICLNYLKLLDSNNLSKEEIYKLKKELFSLRVPSKYRGLHLQLVTIMNKTLKYLQDGEKEKILAQETIISSLQSQYKWLK